MNFFNHHKSFIQTHLSFLFLAIFLRIFFILSYHSEIDISFLEIIKIFLFGIVFDIFTICYLTIIPIIYFVAVPYKFFNKKSHQIFLKICYFIFIFIIIFSIFSEIIFFDEFNVRFNFIAVDYLIYTTEVIENIIESYPIVAIFSLIFVITLIIFYFSHSKIIKTHQQKFFIKLKLFFVILSILLFDFFLIDNNRLTKYFNNNYNKELAQNGIYQLFSAYRNNQIDFYKFYLSNDSKTAEQNLRNLIKLQEPYANFINETSIARHIKSSHKLAKNPNVIFVAIESLSSQYLQYFGDPHNLTPNLNELAKKSLFLTNLKATGTRTVRGLEALTLSIPPTPGNSIVRRPNNENLFNIATPLINKGYDAKFIYGGDGYFDNMNYFFANNGYKIIDRTKFSSDEITFSNAWGVADEDLFNKAIKEADESYEKNQPFFNFVLTTSNHRPYTYPDSKIDIPSKTNRGGAVKYTDYAIGELIKKARLKPWFDNTIFVFVADHCAGSAGKNDLPVWRYQIPAIFYSPKIIKPQIFSKNASQIDIAPTLLDLMGISYDSKFFGVNLLQANSKYSSRAFISTYTDLGYFNDNRLYILKLKKNHKVYDVLEEKFGYQGSKETLTQNFDENDFSQAINYYQVANDYFINGNLKNSTDILKK